MPELRINERIRIKTVRLIDENGVQVGVISTDDARKMARERGYDLVEVSPTAAPPVCRILDYGKYKYAEHKKLQQAKKKQHKMQIKEIRLHPRTEEHDFMVKLNHTKEFLKIGDKVIVCMVFRGREMAHRELGDKLMDRFVKETADVGKVDTPISRRGSRFSMTLAPLK